MAYTKTNGSRTMAELRQQGPRTMSRIARNSLRLSVLGVLLGILALGAGCQSSTGSRTAGQVVDDATIQTRLKTALLRDPEIKGLLINTQVRQGVVTLEGRVSSREQQQAVVGIAAGIRGVVEVDDRLSVVTE
jgi:hyperosmotically inducible periplasmic protein